MSQRIALVCTLAVLLTVASAAADVAGADGFVRMGFSGALEDGEIRGACRVTGGDLCTFTASRR